MVNEGTLYISFPSVICCRFVFTQPYRMLCFVATSRQAAISAVVFHISHMVLSVVLKWVLVQRFSEVDGVCCTTSWFGFRKQVRHATRAYNNVSCSGPNLSYGSLSPCGGACASRVAWASCTYSMPCRPDKFLPPTRRHQKHQHLHPRAVCALPLAVKHFYPSSIVLELSPSARPVIFVWFYQWRPPFASGELAVAET